MEKIILSLFVVLLSMNLRADETAPTQDMNTGE